MIVESIKELLGEELAGKVETALKGKGKEGKDLDLVVGNDGSYVPADKHEGLKSQVEAGDKALKEAAKALKAIGGSGDPQKIADDVKTAHAAWDTLEQNHKMELTSIRKNTALRAALAGKAHDPADIVSQLKLDDIEVDDAGNLKTDLDGLLKPIRESKPYLFVQQEDAAGGDPPPIKGAHPAEPGKPAAEEAPAGPTIF